ncbi:MAG: NAD(P)H-dependent glycerol-3-phosphate dehydrogenase [Pseudomonadota bacterium]
MKVSTLGAGAFGRAMAKVASHGGPSALLGRRGGEGVDKDIAAGLGQTDIVMLAVPAQATRAALTMWASAMPDSALLVLLAKGLERGTRLRQSEIAAELAPGRPILALTGPSFAADILDGLPTAVTLATSAENGETVQRRLAAPGFRPYLTDDLTGAELGGALKNVFAIACGAAVGLGLGESARAALMTRGFAEMTRLAVAEGGRADTLAGLSGLGDLALTCATPKSRNFALGVSLGRGDGRPAGVTQEGAETAASALEKARAAGVDAPIVESVAALVAGETTPKVAMNALLNRPLRRET